MTTVSAGGGSMKDIRIERWAHTLINYTLFMKAGDVLAIYATPLAAALVEAVYCEALRAGAQPIAIIDLENLEAILLHEGNDSQLTFPSPVLDILAEKVDAQLSIASRSNPKALSGAAPARMAKRREAFGAMTKLRRS